ncbi:MAG: ester cyclase [Thermoleophilia bacterium]
MQNSPTWTALRFIDDVVNDGNLSATERFFSAGHVIHDPLFDDLPDGPEGMALRSSRYRTAFPDLRFRVDGVSHDDPVVVIRGVAGGTHLGPLLEHQPTGQIVLALVFYWFRFEGDLIAETWTTSSAQRSCRQLGLVSATGAVPFHGGG